MTTDEVVDIMRQALYLIIECSAPMLLISLAIGLLVSIFQTMTSIQEQTLTFVPKIVGVFVGIMLFGSWIATNLTDFMTELWGNFNTYIK